MTYTWLQHAFSAMNDFYIFQGFDVSVLARKRPSPDLTFTFFTFVCVRSCKSECGVLVGGYMKEKRLHLWPVLQKPSLKLSTDENVMIYPGIREREAQRRIRARGRRAAGIPHVLLFLALIRENTDFRWTRSGGIPPFLCSALSSMGISNY